MLKNTPGFSSFSVPNLEVIKKFYSETLGLQVTEREEGLEIELMGGAHVFVYPSPTNKPAEFTILNFMVEDVEKTVDELNAKGVMMEQYHMPPYIDTNTKGIAQQGSGRKMAWFKDPAGNIIGLLQEK
jgi:predicted enzyme related to lactoylglutathione lyase